MIKTGSSKIEYVTMGYAFAPSVTIIQQKTGKEKIL